VDDRGRQLEALRARASDPDRQTDKAPWSPLPAPATAAELDAAESRLGFPLPPQVRRVYATIANGGFGPGSGLVGIGGGHPGFHSGARTWFCDDKYTTLRSNPQIRWPPRVLPVCDWGCFIYCCIDASHPDAPMLRMLGDALYDAPPLAFTPMDCTFSQWLQAWVSGEDLWEGLFPLNPSQLPE
jgi:hypothetical protein